MHTNRKAGALFAILAAMAMADGQMPMTRQTTPKRPKPTPQPKGDLFMFDLFGQEVKAWESSKAVFTCRALNKKNALRKLQNWLDRTWFFGEDGQVLYGAKSKAVVWFTDVTNQEARAKFQAWQEAKLSV